MTLGSLCRVPTSAASPISTSCKVKQKDRYCEMATLYPKKLPCLNLKLSLLCFTFIYISMYLFFFFFFYFFILSVSQQNLSQWENDVAVNVPWLGTRRPEYKDGCHRLWSGRHLPQRRAHPLNTTAYFLWCCTGKSSSKIMTTAWRRSL